MFTGWPGTADLVELSLLGEFMQSFSEDPDRKKEDDIAYRARRHMARRPLALEGNYHYAGRTFTCSVRSTRRTRS